MKSRTGNPSVHGDESRAWAIPYRFGKRSAMPYRFGKRSAMPYRFGKRSAMPYRFGKRSAMPYRFGKRAAAMHFRLGKKSASFFVVRKEVLTTTKGGIYSIKLILNHDNVFDFVG
ncbi:unnamed protein product [Rotaria magnacalcarata]|uniref:Uncharacterized protein n=1 Tax=Rotaria magnacalcarata TaxID=392030 RepID=A0A8S3IP67_9BILA|nr:unnamed protein product [Rotaria magnacalcarata]